MNALELLHEMFANSPKISYKILSDDQADLLDGTPIDSDAAHCAVTLKDGPATSAESVIGNDADGNTGAYIFVDVIFPTQVHRFVKACRKYEMAEAAGLDVLRKLAKLGNPTQERVAKLMRARQFKPDIGQFDPGSTWPDNEEDTYGEHP